jgi:imidazolonepropionase-like amidohydrolase
MASPRDPKSNASTKAGKVAIKDVRIFHSEQLTAPTSVVIDGGVIVSDATGAQEIDGANGVLLPGLIDSHVHLEGERHLQRMADRGVTTALGMEERWPEKLQALREREGLTDILSACIAGTTPGVFIASYSRFLRKPSFPVLEMLRGAGSPRKQTISRFIAECSEPDNKMI